MGTLSELYKVWNEFSKEYPNMAQEDYDCIKKGGIPEFPKGDKNHIGFNFNYLPQPWWGNIKNPNMIVLVLNPRINSKPLHDNKNKEEQDDIDYRSQIKNITSDSINWLNFEKSDSGIWWRQTFDDILKQTKTKISENDINEKVGCFELFGYHSNNAFSNGNYNTNEKLIKGEFGIDETKMLPTQKAVVKHIQSLLEDEDRLLVIIWGQKYWKELLGLSYSPKEDNEYLDYIDIVSPQSHKLSRGNLRPRDFQRILEKLTGPKIDE